MIVDFAKEITKQGHRATGSLIESLEFDVKDIIDGVQLNMYAHKYGIYVDKGVKASRIRHPFAPPRIKALMRWVKTKGLASSRKQVRSIAYAIAWTHKNVVWSHGFGMPTRRAMTFSSTGKRTDWINQTINKEKARIMEKLKGDYTRELTVEFDNIIRKQSQTLKALRS